MHKWSNLTIHIQYSLVENNDDEKKTKKLIDHSRFCVWTCELLVFGFFSFFRRFQSQQSGLNFWPFHLYCGHIRASSPITRTVDRIQPPVLWFHFFSFKKHVLLLLLLNIVPILINSLHNILRFMSWIDYNPYTFLLVLLHSIALVDWIFSILFFICLKIQSTQIRSVGLTSNLSKS